MILNQKKLGEISVETGLITDKQLAEALKSGSEQKNKRLGTILVEKGFAKEEDIAKTLAYQLNLPYVEILERVVTTEAMSLVSEKLALKYNIMPLYIEKGKFIIAMSDPLNLYALNDVRFASNLEIRPVISTVTEITMAIKKHYNFALPIEHLMKDVERDKSLMVIREVETTKDVSELIKKSKTPPIIKMVDSIIINGVGNKASDIHIEPHKSIVKLRMRIDGLLRDITQIPKWVQASIVSRIKIMANMDIAERRLPQDGRIKVILEGRELDLRVSTLPTQYGEKVVMRILDTQESILTLDDIGLDGSRKEELKDTLSKPQGIVLVSGPTGSGKTSSLYAMINQVKNDRLNIVTLEDPIEYELKEVNQVHINEKAGLSFAYCLRSILRQDPDVIFVGEMRDAETTNISFKASITGHLVFSTVHTLDAVSSITRLKNMDIPPYLIASGLNGIMAQRLVRKICNLCREEYSPSDDDLKKISTWTNEEKEIALYKGKGCKKCGFTGYMGRIGIFELMVIDKKIREMIASGAHEEEIREVAISRGMVSMSDDGMKKVVEGITTLEELKRVIGIKRDVISTGHELSEEVSQMRDICPWCSKSIGPNLQKCTYCDRPLLFKCLSCNRKTQPAWKLCPFCGTSLKKPLEDNTLTIFG
ncbi:MAG: ATPase, T2SS/T4P/T4SS family [Thermodesulfobacteriota bacterium]